MKTPNWFGVSDHGAFGMSLSIFSSCYEMKWRWKVKTNNPSGPWHVGSVFKHGSGNGTFSGLSRARVQILTNAGHQDKMVCMCNDKYNTDMPMQFRVRSSGLRIPTIYHNPKDTEIRTKNGRLESDVSCYRTLTTSKLYKRHQKVLNLENTYCHSYQKLSPI
jgi:hypothetical protein